MNTQSFDLAQWLHWMENNHPTEIELGLERVGSVFTKMQVDLSTTKIITLAGTNGKGTTTALLESVYRSANYRTLAYTSPHLIRYNERVRIDAEEVQDQLLVDAFCAIDRARGDISLSYFEMGTLAALWLVGQIKPDIALLEVGLGGRLDAVNIVDADVAVITTLGIDHVDWLGDDIEQIGREKAGVARTGKPLVCGEYAPPSSIEQLCTQEGIFLYQAKRDFIIDVKQNDWSWQGLDNDGNAIEYAKLPLSKLPLQNAATALQALTLLGLPCSRKSIEFGIANARVTGRQQRFDYRGSSVLLDVAHNPQSAAYLAQELTAQSPNKDVQLVLGVLADKDSVALVEALKPLIAHWHLVTLHVPRGQSALQLKQALLDNSIDESNISCHADMECALSESVKAAAKNDRVLVAGSFFTVSDALLLIEKEN